METENLNHNFNQNNDEPINIRNLCSWLLIFTPQELSILSSILAIIITTPLTLAEQAVVGSFLVAVSDNILLISAQQLLINAAQEEQQALIDRENAKIEKTKQEEEKRKEAIEKMKEQQEIKDLREKVSQLEELIKNHLKTSL